MGGQEVAPGQQLYLATGSARPGPGSKHLREGEDRKEAQARPGGLREEGLGWGS